MIRVHISFVKKSSPLTLIYFVFVDEIFERFLNWIHRICFAVEFSGFLP